jgi:cytolysin (calcineurin-like family phosphatase)
VGLSLCLLSFGTVLRNAPVILNCTGVQAKLATHFRGLGTFRTSANDNASATRDEDETMANDIISILSSTITYSTYNMRTKKARSS